MKVMRSVFYSVLHVLFSVLAVSLAGYEYHERVSTVSLKKGGVSMIILVQSKAFEQNETIPQRYTGEGADISPPVTWSDLPDETKEIALIMDDPDAPTTDPWVHWVMYKIPPQIHELSEGIPNLERLNSPTGALQGVNTAGTIGYHGPMPPKGHGLHHYHFKLFALDVPMELKPGLDKTALLRTIDNHVIGEGELIGTYQR